MQSLNIQICPFKGPTGMLAVLFLARILFSKFLGPTCQAAGWRPAAHFKISVKGKSLR
jgi:hypothetical protein